MNRFTEAVTEFHRAFEHPAGDGCLDDINMVALRKRLIREEFNELCDACDQFHAAEGHKERYAAKVDILDALADLQYVLSGFGIVFGLPVEEAFERVHKANMAKLFPDGRPHYREDGKVLKPDGWTPPVLDDLV